MEQRFLAEEGKSRVDSQGLRASPGFLSPPGQSPEQKPSEKLGGRCGDPRTGVLGRESGLGKQGSTKGTDIEPKSQELLSGPWGLGWLTTTASWRPRRVGGPCW